MKISAILYSSFDPVAGPKIEHQVPADYISKEDFDSIHNYIITKPELKGRLITVNAHGHIFVGCPVIIDNKKYARNALIFNLCFVFDNKTETSNYEPVVKKLASYLTQLETDSGFLSKEENKQNVPRFLHELMTKLNKDGNCSIPISEWCTVHLKVPPIIVDPSPVKEYDVPIFLKEQHIQNSMSTWDLTTLQVLHHIDGFNHVAKIAVEADVEINLLKACLQNLMHYKVITMISIFQYSNVYMATPKISLLSTDMKLQTNCIRYVSLQDRVLPTLRDVFTLYTTLTSVGTTVKDLCCRFNIAAMKVDEKKLIQFGLMNGLIRKLNKFPILAAQRNYSNDQSLYKYCNGLHSFDDICTATGLSYMVLDEKIDNDENIVICLK